VFLKSYLQVIASVSAAACVSDQRQNIYKALLLFFHPTAASMQSRLSALRTCALFLKLSQKKLYIKEVKLNI
jgi:hypothetical protein